MFIELIEFATRYAAINRPMQTGHQFWPIPYWFALISWRVWLLQLICKLCIFTSRCLLLQVGVGYFERYRTTYCYLPSLFFENENSKRCSMCQVKRKVKQWQHGTMIVPGVRILSSTTVFRIALAMASAYCLCPK